MAHSADHLQVELASVGEGGGDRQRNRLGDGDPQAWENLQPDPWAGTPSADVVRHDADTGPDERNIESSTCRPLTLVLIATPKAQERIDLHHYCRHVVLFDLTWNPAAMEQRIGRVHRTGRYRKGVAKGDVVYCFQGEPMSKWWRHEFNSVVR